MTRETYLLRTSEAFSAHRAAHPDLRAEDAVKFFFQALLGPGHLLSDPDTVERRIAAETQALTPDPAEPLTEELSPDWCRLNLRRAMAEGLTARHVANMMLRSRPSFSFTCADAEALCSACLPKNGLPLPPEAAAVLRDPQGLPSHSAAYRERYRPAYRVVSAGWQPLLPALTRVAGKRAQGRRLLVTLDGPCASGKTTLAGALAAVLGAAVVHTDDFVVPHAFKTPERLSLPGGNCDAERLAREVVVPWKEKGAATVIRYDCHGDRMLPGEPIGGEDVLILEGSYCNLPLIRQHADVRLFADTPTGTRMGRLRRRESPESLARFMSRWIPLEEAYFSAFGLPDTDCIRIPG